jgi:hypothetical protein
MSCWFKGCAKYSTQAQGFMTREHLFFWKYPPSLSCPEFNGGIQATTLATSGNPVSNMDIVQDGLPNNMAGNRTVQEPVRYFPSTFMLFITFLP